MGKAYHQKKRKASAKRKPRLTEAKEEQPSLQLSFERTEVMKQLQEGLHQVGVSVALQLAGLLLEEEAERLCGPRYRHNEDRKATRHGHQPGVVTIAGQKVRLDRPRVRAVGEKGELNLSVYEAAQREDAMPQAVLQRAVRGVSTRDYEGVIEAAAEGFGVKRSSVSRAFVAASKTKIDELFNRGLDDVRFPVIFIDGVAYAETMMIVALGLAEDGSKRVLGFREGPTENAEVCKSLLRDLIDRGLSLNQATLFVIDGSKALRKAITALWGPRALVQRCRAHKKRNVQGHVPKKHWDEVKTMLAQAWQEPDAKRALKRLKTLASWLDRIAPDAASSLREGLEDTITVTRLGLDPALAVHLHTTNPIESAFSVAARLTGRVKRWRDGAMKRRWCATGLLEVEKHFRRIKGFRQMPQLIALL